jgi:di/tricarboxylate transporter
LFSGGGWIADTLLLVALVGLAGAQPQVANLFSASTAAAMVYLIAHHRVHSGTPHGVELRLGLYLVYTGIVTLVASSAMIPVTVTAARMLGAEPAGMAAAFVAKCLVTPPQLVCNFLVSRALARASGSPRDA